MKLKLFVQQLNEFLEVHPEASEFEVVTAKDDEGNGFNPVYWAPSLGCYNPDDWEFLPADHVEECPEDYEGYDTTPNAVCVN